MNKKIIVFTTIALLIINTFSWIIKIANKLTPIQEIFLYGRELTFFEGLSNERSLKQPLLLTFFLKPRILLLTKTIFYNQVSIISLILAKA